MVVCFSRPFFSRSASTSLRKTRSRILTPFLSGFAHMGESLRKQPQNILKYITENVL